MINIDAYSKRHNLPIIQSLKTFNNHIPIVTQQRIFDKRRQRCRGT